MIYYIIGFDLFVFIVLALWLQKREKYLEPLPEGVDPRDKAHAALWHRAPQNKKRRRKALTLYLIFVGLTILAYFLITNYRIVSANGEETPVSTEQLADPDKSEDTPIEISHTSTAATWVPLLTSTPTASPTPKVVTYYATQLVEVTREIPVEITRIIQVEVTRMVEVTRIVVITASPTFTPTPSATPTSTASETPSP